jgi:hypothetical protein
MTGKIKTYVDTNGFHWVECPACQKPFRGDLNNPGWREWAQHIIDNNDRGHNQYHTRAEQQLERNRLKKPEYRRKKKARDDEQDMSFIN